MFLWCYTMPIRLMNTSVGRDSFLFAFDGNYAPAGNGSKVGSVE